MAMSFPTWGPAWPQRLGAAIMAAGVTITLLTMFRAPALLAGPLPRATITVLLWPSREPLRPPSLEGPHASTPPRRIVGPTAVPGTDRLQGQVQGAWRAAEATHDAPHTEIAAPAAAASQPEPLRLELRPGAAGAARSSFRSMAEVAGTYSGDERPSQQQRLAAGIAKGARADCLAPNENASLLSAVAMAFGAVAGRCK